MSEVSARACRKCGAEKPLTSEFFSKHKTHSGGLNVQCKSCRSEATRTRKAADPERAKAKQKEATARYLAKQRGTEEWKARVKEQNRKQYEKNKAARVAYAKEWNRNNPEKAKAAVKKAIAKRPEYYRILSGKWQRENPEKSREKSRKWREKHLSTNPDRILIRERLQAKKWRADNPDKIRQMNIKRHAKMKSEAGPAWIRQRMSAAIRQSIIFKLGGGRKKGNTWNKLVGYSTETLIRHIARQFRDGMEWSNWGKVWHLDHIQPIASFTFTAVDCPEFRACWALSNLRPIPVKENLSKSKKRLYLL